MQNEILKCNWGTRGKMPGGRRGCQQISQRTFSALGCVVTSPLQTKYSCQQEACCGVGSTPIWWQQPGVHSGVGLQNFGLSFLSLSSSDLEDSSSSQRLTPGFQPSTDVCQPMASSPLHHSGLSHLARASLPVPYALRSCFLSLYIIARVCLLKHNGPENSWTQIQGLFIF